VDFLAVVIGALVIFALVLAYVSATAAGPKVQGSAAPQEREPVRRATH
jgi:hypothetical protein